MAVEEKNFYSTAPEPPKESPLSALDQEELIDYFGLGKRDASSDWRDQKLEAKVAGLFKQTIELSHLPSAVLHPDDVEIRNQLPEIQERLSRRLFELRYKSPEQFNELYDFLFNHSFNQKLEKEMEAMTKGAHPGTSVPPWQEGNLMWKNFFESHLADWNTLYGFDFQRDRYKFTEGLEDIQSRLDHEDQEHPLADKYPWLPEKKKIRTIG